MVGIEARGSPGLSTLMISLDHLANYFSECTVLSTLNVDVDSLNKSMLSQFLEQVRVLYSADFIPPSEQSGGVDPCENVISKSP